MSDNRFDTSKPVFKSSKSKQNKIKVDDRFKDILTNEKFIAEPGQIDKYGRKLKKKKSSSKELAEFYEIEDEVTDEAPVESLKTNKLVSKQQSTKSASKSGTGVKIEDRLDYLTKLARGEIEESSDEEIDDKRYEYEDDEDENLDNDNDLNASEKVTLGPLALENPDEVEEGEATQRIALQNCDWENLKAIDIL